MSFYAKRFAPSLSLHRKKNPSKTAKQQPGKTLANSCRVEQEEQELRILEPRVITIQPPSVPKEDSVGILPPGQGSDVLEGIDAASANVSAPRSFTLEVKNDGAGDANEQTKETSASNATGLASLGPLSPSDEGAVLNNDLIEKTDGYLSDEHSFEHNQSKL